MPSLSALNNCHDRGSQPYIREYCRVLLSIYNGPRVCLTPAPLDLYTSRDVFVTLYAPARHTITSSAPQTVRLGHILGHIDDVI